MRGDLHGSGGESVVFHLLQMEIGYRSPAYYQALARLNILTLELEAAWREPSLNDELMHLLSDRGVFRARQAPGWQARRLARIMRASGEPHPQAALHDLCKAALAFDREWRTAKHIHYEMVLGMIADKPSVGAGGERNHDRLSQHPKTRPIGGRRYLQLTRNESFFPTLRRSLRYLQENWRTNSSTQAH